MLLFQYVAATWVWSRSCIQTSNFTSNQWFCWHRTSDFVGNSFSMALKGDMVFSFLASSSHSEREACLLRRHNFCLLYVITKYRDQWYQKKLTSLVVVPFAWEHTICRLGNKCIQHKLHFLWRLLCTFSYSIWLMGLVEISCMGFDQIHSLCQLLL